MSDNRSIVYFDPSIEAWVYRASSVGRGLRCLATARQGYDPLPPPDYLETAAEEGNRYEPIVKARLREEGYRISGEQGEFDLPVEDGVIIRGHLDGQHCLEPDSDTDRVLEVKSMSDRVWKKWQNWSFRGFPEYAAQVTVYMEAERRRRRAERIEATYAVINRDTEEMEVRTLTRPPADFEAIIQQVKLAEWFGQAQQLPICDSESQYSCPYSYLCDKEPLSIEELEGVAGDNEAALRHLLEQHEELHRTIETLKANKEKLRNEIRGALGGRDAMKMNGWSISNKPWKENKLNLVKLRARLGEDLDLYFEEGETDPRLTIRKTKEK